MYAQYLSDATVEHLLAQVGRLDVKHAGPTFSLWVPEALTLGGKPASQDIAMALVLDQLLRKGYFPDGFEPGVGGRRYKYKNEEDRHA